MLPVDRARETEERNGVGERESVCVCVCVCVCVKFYVSVFKCCLTLGY